MKNLVRLGINKLEDTHIENLGVRSTSMTRARADGYWHRRNRYKGKCVSDTKSRIIENNIGKSFDLAFSYYCKNCRKQDQHLFLDEFTSYSSYRFDNYYIDENGNIQINRDSRWFRFKSRNRKPIQIESDDFKTELVHIVTGHKKDDFGMVYEQVEGNIQEFDLRLKKYIKKRGIVNGKFSHYKYGINPLRMKPEWKRYNALEEHFKVVVTQGWFQQFESKNDPRFKKYMAERAKGESRQNRLQRRLKAEKAYNFMTATEKKLKEEKEENKLKILAQGFDPITSFRGKIN